ncbi:MAG TPA: hypothetical protein VL371_07750 [Gemmataceae bacterium]|jgi:hypothetical protein|nr:hypothetical protein [Gemmataceae bacterium]
MMNAFNDTIRSGAVIDYRAPAASNEDLTPYMMRIIRRALRQGGGGTPLDRAIRSAVAVCEPAGGDSRDPGDDARIRELAGRLSATFAPRIFRAAGGPERHRATVCA